MYQIVLAPSTWPTSQACGEQFGGELTNQGYRIDFPELEFVQRGELIAPHGEKDRHVATFSLNRGFGDISPLLSILHFFWT